MSVVVGVGGHRNTGDRERVTGLEQHTRGQECDSRESSW